MIIALGLVAVSFNAFGAKYLPLLEGVLLLFEIIGERSPVRQFCSDLPP